MRPLVILRPEPGAGQTLANAKARGLETTSIPLFVVEPVSWAIPKVSAFDGLLLTSANAVRMAGADLSALTALPVFAVGEATASAARAGGFDVAKIGDAGVAELIRSLPSELALLHLCGADRRDPAAGNHSITPLIVYRSRALPEPCGVEQIGGAVVLVHSPRAGARLSELIPDHEHTAVVAISPAAAEACGSGWETVQVAGSPDDQALLSLAERLCKDSHP